MLQKIWPILKQAFSDWNKHNVTQLGAALAYYTVFSLAPLLLIVISVAGFLFGNEAAEGEVVKQLSGLVGVEGAKFIQTVLQNSTATSSGVLSSLFGLIALIIGATGVFTQLKDSLNTVWEVPHHETRLRDLVRARFISFMMIVGIGFLLLVSLILSAWLTILVKGFSDYLGGPTQLLLQTLNLFIAFLVETLLFAMMYKLLPDVHLSWKDVWFGAATTALLFELGKLLIALYIAHYATASTFGAAGSLIVILLWVYYSSQIVLFGAELAQVYTKQVGSMK